MQFEFYVLNYDWNVKQAFMYNIFNNIRVQEASEKAVKKYLRNPKEFSYRAFLKDEPTLYGFEAFVMELKSIIAWQEMSRCEYEIGVANAFETDINKLEKIDCYYQACANIEIIAHEVIRQYKEQKKINKK